MTSRSPSDILPARLAELREQRDRTVAELATERSGDPADRATNVDANIRFALLEQRIHSIEIELSNPSTPRGADGQVAPGSMVTLDLGDGPETFLFGTLEQSGGGLDVVTPGSPLGAAIDGAVVGSTVSYVTSSRRRLKATVVAVR